MKLLIAWLTAEPQMSHSLNPLSFLLLSDSIHPLIEDKKAQFRNYQGLIEDVSIEESDIEEEFRQEINGQVQLNGLKEDLGQIIQKWRNGGYDL